MRLKESIQGDIAIVKVSGNMMGGPESQELHDKIKSLTADGLRKIVIDIKDVKWMNSSGLGTLMSCMTTISDANGRLKLSNVAEKVKSVLMITKLIEIFDTYETAERAVANFHEADKGA